MKKILLILIWLVGADKIAAQNELPADTIGVVFPGNVKLFGDFILDMNILMPPKLPEFNADPFSSELSQDYNLLFQLPESLTYSRGYVQSHGPMFGTGFFASSSSLNLHSASFKLNDKMILSTFGQYDMYGRKRSNPNALPWEKDNFIGGMELKFNKSFGVRIEVQHRRNPMYP